MTTTYQLISSVTVGSGGAANIEFTSIPATYTDLLVKFSGRVDANNEDTSISFNSSTSNLSSRYIYGSGTVVGSATSATKIYTLHNRSTFTANSFGNSEFYIPNYTSSNYKSVSTDSVNETNATDATKSFNAGLWSNSAAITSIKLTPDSGNFVQHSTAYLYGISNA